MCAGKQGSLGNFSQNKCLVDKRFFPLHPSIDTWIPADTSVSIPPTLRTPHFPRPHSPDDLLKPTCCTQQKSHQNPSASSYPANSYGRNWWHSKVPLLPCGVHSQSQQSDLIPGSAECPADLCVCSPSSTQKKSCSLGLCSPGRVGTGIWSVYRLHPPIKSSQRIRQGEHPTDWCYCSPNRQMGAGIWLESRPYSTRKAIQR